MHTPPSRTPFVLAAIGAGLAALFWAGWTLLLASSGASGPSPTQVILPIVLVVLYGWRGFRLLQGDPTAARSLLWLHGLGGVMAAIGIANGGMLGVIQGVKLVIHVFGGLTALWALRAHAATAAVPVARYP
jgi:hypothetical protein